MSTEEFKNKAGELPRYIDLEESRRVLASIGIDLTERQMKRAAEPDVQGKRKIPYFIDPIDGKLKISEDTLLRIYVDRQAEAARNATLDI